MPDDNTFAWHSPVFEQVLCGNMTDRERLGLPDHYVADRFASDYGITFDRLRTATRDALAVLCEDRRAALLERLVAGNILAVLGDPRVDTFNPKMIPIIGGQVSIGLATAEIERVLATFSGLGLDRKWIAKECPRHTVSLASFAIARYPLTNSEFRDFLQDAPHTALPSSWEFGRFPTERSNHPVYTIEAADADAYCAWLRERTGRPFRLPTEAEWEYAASGPEGLEFPWGDQFNADFANTAETGIFQTSAVGVFADGNSPFSLCDMAGNVEEYVSDRYRPYPGGELIVDHLANIHGDYRIARGGSCVRFRDLARTRRRHGHNPRSAVYAMGFRLAEDMS